MEQVKAITKKIRATAAVINNSTQMTDDKPEAYALMHLARSLEMISNMVDENPLLIFEIYKQIQKVHNNKVGVTVIHQA